MKHAAAVFTNDKKGEPPILLPFPTGCPGQVGRLEQGLQIIPAHCVAHINQLFRLQRVGVNSRPLHDRMMTDDRIKDRVPVLCFVLQLPGQGPGLHVFEDLTERIITG